MTSLVESFLAAAGAAEEVLRRPAVESGWDDPSALRGYTVGAVAAHLLLATERTESVLHEPEPDGATVVGVAEFYGVNRVEGPGDEDEGLHPLVRQAATKLAEAGPAAVTERFAGLLDRLRDSLPGVPPDRLVTVLQVPGGATTLADYLRTRVVELVVHADDLAASVGPPPLTMPPAAVDVAIGVFVELARARSGDLAVVRAFSRAERADPDTLRAL